MSVQPLWSVVHVFDPSYRGTPGMAVCMCGLPREDDIHATPLIRPDVRQSVSELVGTGSPRP
jgi:hypothetical protein